jgi:hypothetical protein
MWGCDLWQKGVQITAVLGNMLIFAHLTQKTKAK